MLLWRSYGGCSLLVVVVVLVLIKFIPQVHKIVGFNILHFHLYLEEQHQLAPCRMDR